jgi:hypothetical protein
MTPLVEANHNSHDDNSLARRQCRGLNAPYTRMTRKNGRAREDSLMRRIVSQRGTANSSYFASSLRKITTFSRGGCCSQTLILRNSASSSVDILNLSQRA